MRMEAHRIVDAREIIMVGRERGCGEARGRDGLVMLAAEPCSAQASAALGVLEAEDEAVEAAPEVAQRAVGLVGMAAGLEGAAQERKAGDLKSAKVDREIDLAVGVEAGCRDFRTGGGAVLKLAAGVFILERGETLADDAHEVRLHRHGWAAAPEDREDDQPERLHGQAYTRAASPAGSGGLCPRSCGLVG